jgi:hypothetical protein
MLITRGEPQPRKPHQPKEKIMSAQFQCFDDPPAILEKAFCLNALSKNLKGELGLTSSKAQKCQKPECKTLRTVHAVKLKVVGNPPCDSALAKFFDGTLAVDRLVTAFEQDGMHRGFHAGDFVWSGAAGTKIAGRMSGVTNVGTQRLPLKECQKCDDRGIMEGRLCGQVMTARDPAVKGCQVVAAYRIKFDPSLKGGSGAAQGVIEGVIICPCQT